MLRFPLFASSLTAVFPLALLSCSLFATAGRAQGEATSVATPPAATPPAATPPAYSPHSVPRASEIRGIWIHTYSPLDWETTMRKIAAAGFNCVFVRVARGVNTIYPSAYLPRDGWAEEDARKTGGDEMMRAIQAAHRHGLEFHAWKVNFNSSAGKRGGAGPQALYRRMAAEDRLARDPQGNQAAFLNPGDPRNQELEFNVMMEMLTKYPVDGIHFDYIRYTEVGSKGEENYDFDYGAVSRREFEKATGKRVLNWPADVFSGPLKWDYENWERENINRLVRRVYTAAKKARPEAKVSAAVWRAHRKYRAAIKQDWLLWTRQGWLDFMVPMDYIKSEEHETFRETVRSQVANTAGRMPLAAGIGTWLQKTPADMVKQIEIARSEGADGYVLFAYNDEKIDSLLEALAHGPQAQPAAPAYNHALPCRWSLTPGVTRKDDAPAYATGRRITVSCAPLPARSGPSRITAQAWLETLDEKPLLRLGALGVSTAQANPGIRQWSFVAPEGRSRVVLRGTMTGGGGRTGPLVVRGPILEGLSATSIAQLRARDLPPLLYGAGRRVAVYEGGLAWSGLLKSLRGAPGINAYPIYHLRPGHWQSADVLILPQLYDVAELTPRVASELRRWVAAGGRLILTHDATGFRWHARLFPEIGVGIGLSKQKQMEVLPNDLALTPGALQHTSADHVVLQPGASGQVLAREVAAPAPSPTPAGAANAAEAAPATSNAAAPANMVTTSGGAVVVGGRVGRGTVIMHGALLGTMPAGATPTGAMPTGATPAGIMPDAERRLLLELVSRP